MTHAQRCFLLALLLTGWTAFVFFFGLQLGAGLHVTWHRVEFAVPHRFAPWPP